jgi:ABC-type Na+ efflux pump permease subunit
MSDIVVILHKEWADMIRNRIVFSMLVLVPLIMTAIPVVTLYVAGSASATPSDLDQLRPMLSSNQSSPAWTRKKPCRPPWAATC